MGKENKTYLFIGGCADGELYSVPEYEERFPVQEYLPLKSIELYKVHEDKRDVLKIQWYKKEAINFYKGGIIEVFIHEELSPKEAFQKLLDGYKPTPQTKDRG